MAYVLIGFMGAGKSTVARELAEALGTAPLDSDRLLEERLGDPPAVVFERDGEQAFRSAEEQLVGELLARAGEDEVIALGGGSVLSESVRAGLESHTTVMLEVGPAEAWRRVTEDHEGPPRPLARQREAFASLYDERRAIYERLADAILPELSRGAARAVLPALGALAAAPRGTRLLWASPAGGSYPVLVGRGLLAASDPELLARVWPLDLSASRPLCVSDENVVALYGDRLPPTAATIAVAAGERHKTLASAESVWRALTDAGATRGDHVAALGGGVVGDLAGFCAATYQRGVPVVHLPTTLVAQVDSAYGGKTGVDLPQAKNYVGVYHQPAGVLVDPDTLATVPAAELAAGWVEVLKTALIAGGALWQRVAAGADVDERMIFDCARTKLAVVAQDERDSGARQVLNLGHTVGHAIESATGYTRYRHGEAVGLGLLATLRLSNQEDLREMLREMLLARSLPVVLEGSSPEVVVEATSRDKKRIGDRVPFVLLESPGEVSIGREVPAERLLAAVTELCP